jgi:hypothetical protein
MTRLTGEKEKRRERGGKIEVISSQKKKKKNKELAVCRAVTPSHCIHPPTCIP